MHLQRPGEHVSGQRRRREGQFLLYDPVRAEVPAETQRHAELLLRERANRQAGCERHEVHESEELRPDLRQVRRRRSVRDQIQLEGNRESSGLEEHSSTRAGHDKSYCWPAERWLSTGGGGWTRSVRYHGELEHGILRGGA